ncbi:MAG: hypothetical protein EOM91_10055 [Sphingobacteriia bacterium]|nr:hypothetical protein [Sphingobacteriia bacterium]NCC40314.1 hypothetical protein [Gammaproteobacteria bacterium]
MMKRATRLGLLLLLLCPIGILAAEAPEDGDRALDLRLLREDIPREVWRPAPSPPADRLPSLGMQPMQPGGREGMPQKGGFRSDLPYGAGYEARQGARQSQETGQGMVRGGRGMGGGRGR